MGLERTHVHMNLDLGACIHHPFDVRVDLVHRSESDTIFQVAESMVWGSATTSFAPCFYSLYFLLTS
jgi:hypothetical protein